MTAPAEKPASADKNAGGLAQLVRWLTDERPVAGMGDDAAGLFTTAPRRTRWVHGEPTVAPPRQELELDPLAQLRIGPAPRCAVAGETIALSVSLIAEHGGTYLGWPIHLEWSSSDPSVATVSAGGVVHVQSPGRVELTCRCEGKSGSVWLTVVEPAVAASVGLPVPRRTMPLTPAKETRRALPSAVVAPVVLARPRLELSRSGRRFVVRLVGAAVTGSLIAIVLSQSPEDYFVASADPTAAQAARRVTRPANRSPSTRGALRAAAAALTSGTGASPAPIGDSSKGTTMLRESDGRVVAVSAGSTTIGSSARAVPPAAGPVGNQPADVSLAASAPTSAAPVARVAVSSSPSQLGEGETVRLAAAAFDDRGEAVAGRAVSWKSENGDVATVDESGLVTAHRAGTVTLVATSEGRTGRVTLTVGARRGASAEAPPPSSAPARESGVAAVTQLIRARIDEFVQALRERDGARVATLYAAESPQDRKNLQMLLERLRRPETRFKTADPQIGSPEVRELEAAGEFQLPMSWTTPFGRVRNQTPTFRATLEPTEGSWRLVGIRAVGKLD